MASSITAGNTTNGLGITSDNTGVLQLKSGTGAGTVGAQLDASQNLAFNSGYGSVATAYGCRAWVNFNGVTTATIQASGNVSGVVRNSTGNYTITFTNAMPDANYCVVATGLRAAGNEGIVSPETYAAGSLIVNCVGGTGTEADFSVVNIAIFR